MDCHKGWAKRLQASSIAGWQYNANRDYTRPGQQEFSAITGSILGAGEAKIQTDTTGLRGTLRTKEKHASFKQPLPERFRSRCPSPISTSSIPNSDEPSSMASGRGLR